MPDMQPIALHSWTLGARPLADLLDAAARAGYGAVELNWQDIARCREEDICDEQIARGLAERGLRIAALGVAPGLLFARGSDARALREGLRRMSETAAKLGCGLLMTAIGPFEGAVETATENLAAAGDVAAGFGLCLAVEFNFQHRVLHSLDLVQAVVRGSGRANCGLVLDTYHLHRGGHPGRGFVQVRSEEIFLVQVSDVPARPSAAPGVPLDRLPPGEGEVQWGKVFGLLRNKGYTGPLSYEAPNPALWQRPAYEVAAEGLAAIRRLLAEAEASSTA